MQGRALPRSDGVRRTPGLRLLLLEELLRGVLFGHASRPIRDEGADLFQAPDPPVYLVELAPVEVGDRGGARLTVLSLHQASREWEDSRDREVGVQQAANTARTLDCSGIENSVPFSSLRASTGPARS